MRRRHFLQLAGSAAAGAMVAHASPVSVELVPGVVVTFTFQGTVSVTNTIGLGVSGWISPDGPIDVVHVMLETRPEAPGSYPKMELPGLRPGSRHRLRMMNATPSAIAVQLHGGRVELAHYSVVEAELITGSETSV